MHDAIAEGLAFASRAHARGWQTYDVGTRAGFVRIILHRTWLVQGHGPKASEALTLTWETERPFWSTERLFRDGFGTHTEANVTRAGAAPGLETAFAVVSTPTSSVVG